MDNKKYSSGMQVELVGEELNSKDILWYCLGCLSAYLPSELETAAAFPVRPLCPNCFTSLKRQDIK